MTIHWADLALTLTFVAAGCGASYVLLLRKMRRAIDESHRELARRLTLLTEAITTFEPGDEPFGLWISNDGLKDGGVFSQPQVIAAVNARLAKQPYKAMIYPNRDKTTGKPVPHSYIIGWEYSTNDDFQDVVCRLDNADLIGEAEAGGAAK